MALGHATGDGNTWVHWCLWAFGGNLVDEKDKVIINSPETVKALEYASALRQLHSRHCFLERRLQQQGVPGGRDRLTNNGISIYVAAKKDPTKKEIAEDTDHALWPVGPVGKPTEFQSACRCWP